MADDGAHIPAMQTLLQQSAAVAQCAPAEAHAGPLLQVPGSSLEPATHASVQHCPAKVQAPGSPTHPTPQPTSVPGPVQAPSGDAGVESPGASEVGPSDPDPVSPPSRAASLVPSTVASAATRPESASPPGSSTSSVAGLHPASVRVATAASARSRRATRTQ
jgi:hypothetical protein